MSLIEALIEKAKLNPKRVALPECEADKTLLAARRVLDEGIGVPVLVNDPAVIKETAARVGVSLEGMEIVDTTDETVRDGIIARYMKYPKLMLSEKGARRKMKNPMYYAMIMEAAGDVDCTFCGHVNTTGDVLIAAQQTIGMQDGVDVPSIFALTEIPGFEGPEGDRIALADCGLNAEPAPDELRREDPILPSTASSSSTRLLSPQLPKRRSRGRAKSQVKRTSSSSLSSMRPISVSR